MACLLLFGGLAATAAPAPKAQTSERGEYRFATGPAPAWLEVETVPAQWDEKRLASAAARQCRREPEAGDCPAGSGGKTRSRPVAVIPREPAAPSARQAQRSGQLLRPAADLAGDAACREREGRFGFFGRLEFTGRLA
jgi:hypothetical protein